MEHRVVQEQTSPEVLEGELYGHMQESICKTVEIKDIDFATFLGFPSSS